MSLAVTYATAVFEGLRAYRNPETGAFKIFRLAEHVKRLQAGMKVMRMDRRFEVDEVAGLLARLIRANEPDDEGAPRNDGFVMMKNEVEAYRLGDKAFEFKGTNGFMITLDIDSKTAPPPAK